MNTALERRGRRGLALSAVVATALAGTAVLAPATSAAPVGDCDTAYPVSQLAEGQRVTGLTVSKGTTPEGFRGSVVGVLDDGIAPGLDMVVVELTSAEIDRIGGIWAGMSGSPVYASNGELIGAVAYGLTWGNSPVAGVTPFEEMDDLLGVEPPARVRVSKREAAELADGSSLTRAEAEAGFRRLPVNRVMQMQGSLVEQRLTMDRRGREYLASVPRAASAGGWSDAVTAGVETLVPGGNVAATMSYGDVTAGGVGTVTSVCGDRLVGFGHPAEFLGATTLGMHPASVLTVLDDDLGVPYKLANFGDLVGTVTDDRRAGIAGVVGPLPDTLDVTSSVVFGAESRTGVTQVPFQDFGASATFYTLVGNHDRVIDGLTGGSELQSWTIRGTGPDGAAYTLRDADRYRSASDITYTSPWDVADTVWLLQNIPGVGVDSVTVDGDVITDDTYYRIRRVEQYRDGAWATVKSRVRAQAGRTLRLRAVLSDGTTSRNVVWRWDVPRRLAGGEGELTVLGGESDWEYLEADSLPEVLRAARTGLRNDQVRFSVAGYGEGGRVTKRYTTPVQRRVVTGQRYLTVVFR